jgi:hypothetical protein
MRTRTRKRRKRGHDSGPAQGGLNSLTMYMDGYVEGLIPTEHIDMDDAASAPPIPTLKRRLPLCGAWLPDPVPGTDMRPRMGGRLRENRRRAESWRRELTIQAKNGKRRPAPGPRQCRGQFRGSVAE